MNLSNTDPVRTSESGLPKNDGQDGKRALILQAMRDLGKNLSTAVPGKRTSLSDFLKGKSKNPSKLAPELLKNHLGIDPTAYQQADDKDWLAYARRHIVVDPVQAVQMRIFQRRLDAATSGSVAGLWEVLKVSPPPETDLDASVHEVVSDSKAALTNIHNALEDGRELDQRTRVLLVEIGFVLSLGLVSDCVRHDVASTASDDGGAPKTGVVTATMAELWAALLDSAPPRFEKSDREWRGSHAIGVVHAEAGPGDNSPSSAMMQDLKDRTGLPLIQVGDSMQSLRHALYATDRRVKGQELTGVPNPYEDLVLNAEQRASRNPESNVRAYYVLLTEKEADDERMRKALDEAREIFSSIRMFALPADENESLSDELGSLSELFHILNKSA